MSYAIMIDNSGMRVPSHTNDVWYWLNLGFLIEHIVNTEEEAWALIDVKEANK